MKILESNFDTYVFERAWIGGEGEGLTPIALVSGIECCIATKPGLLSDGVAFCEPTDDRLAECWPIYVDYEREGSYQRGWNMTTEPRIVAAARKFEALAREGKAVAGMEL